MESRDFIKVLVIDDDEHIAAFVRETIEAMGVVDEVHTAGDMETAVNLVMSERYAVVLLDLIFNGRNIGPSLAQRVRTANPDTVIIVITGYPAKLFSKELVDVPIDDFIVKPFKAARLQEAVIRACTRYRRRAMLTKCLEEKNRNYEEALQRLKALEVLAKMHLGSGSRNS